MIYTAIPIAFLMGITASDRRYSSTAVGFPIRNDLSAFLKRLPKGFPSWVGVRAACTYVHMRPNCQLSASDSLACCSPSRRVLVGYCRIVPTDCEDTTRRDGAQFIIYPSSIPHHSLLKPLCAPTNLPKSTQQIPCVLAPRYPKSAHQKQPISTSSPKVLLRFNSCSTQSSLESHSQLTWESLARSFSCATVRVPHCPGHAQPCRKPTTIHL